MFKTCQECRGQCCTFFGIAEPWIQVAIAGMYVPYHVLESIFSPDAKEYFKHRDGVTCGQHGIYIDKRVIGKKRTTPGGTPVLIIKSVCAQLDADFSCKIYATRPDPCRYFDGGTMKYFLVPSGCKYDKDALYGSDYNA